MKHASGQFLHEGRWCSEKEIERLRREAEDDPEAKERLRRMEDRCGIEQPGPFAYQMTTKAGAWSPRDDSWTEYDSEETYRAAVSYSRGAYQLAVLDGLQNLSTTTVGMWMDTTRKTSRDNLLKRLERAGFVIQERRKKARGKSGSPRRILVISRGRR